MGEIGKVLLTIFGAVITLAIISVIISRRSRAPEAIQALTGGLANIVGRAVAPQSAITNGDNGTAAFASPTMAELPSLSDLWSSVTH